MYHAIPFVKIPRIISLRRISMTDNIVSSGKTVTRQLTQYYVPLNIFLCAQCKTIQRIQTRVTVKKMTR